MDNSTYNYVRQIDQQNGGILFKPTHSKVIIAAMGILGLLQYIKQCLRERHLGDYRGQTAAVDTYAWLHKIIKGPSGRQLIIGGPNRYRFVNDCLKRIAKIQGLGVKVIMVFDGGPLPGKKEEEQVRRKRREETFAKGKEMLQQGDEAGFKKLVDSIDITPDIAYRLIAELRKKGIDFMVAPYEADAQLAYLNRAGIADFIITEDSDLMAFGAKRMLYKLDFSTMTGSELQVDLIPMQRQVNFNWFTHCMFLTTCILSGCDYLNQIAGVGLKTAQKSIGRVTTFRGFLGEVSNKSLVPPDYQAGFMRAFLTFRFQRVYCPLRKACVELNDMSLLSQSLESLLQQQKQARKWSEEVMNVEVMEYVQMNQLDFDFLGEKYSSDLAIRIAQGRVHPVTFAEYDVESAQALTYVPSVPLRSNSTIMNAKRMQAKGPKIFKKKKQEGKESNTLFKYLTGASQPQNIMGKKYDPTELEYRSVKDGDDRMFRLEAKQTEFMQDADKLLEEFKPVKGGLRVTEDNEDSEDEKSVNISYIQSDSVEEISMHSLSLAPKAQKSCKNELEEIADRLFGQIFSQQYLKSPFSF